MKASSAAGEFLMLMVWQAAMINSRRVPHVCQAAASGSSAGDLLHTPSVTACHGTAVLTLQIVTANTIEELPKHHLPPSKRLVALAQLGWGLPLLYLARSFWAASFVAAIFGQVESSSGLPACTPDAVDGGTIQPLLLQDCGCKYQRRPGVATHGMCNATRSWVHLGEAKR